MDVKMKLPPPLDPGFVPVALWHREYERMLQQAPSRRKCEILLSRTDGVGFPYSLELLPDEPQYAELNYTRLERTVKFLLWQKGAPHVTIVGADTETARLRRDYAPDGERAFDYEFFGQQVYLTDFKVEAASRLPEYSSVEASTQLGGNWDGCRIGFDLGGSDRKVAAVIDGKVVYADEIRWDPYYQPDINYHYEGIQDSLKKAAAHLPRVDAIGGSAAGCYVNNEARVASLFRGIAKDRFGEEARPLFKRIQAEWNNVPFVVVNDGEVSAIAGAQALGVTRMLGISLGTSMAGGYVTASGGITPWLNELAFSSVDYRENGPQDEWSRDRGVGSQYFSQQAVARLIPAAGIEVPAGMAFPEQLVEVQELMKKDDPRARKIFECIGIYLGYSLAYYTRFYDLEHVLLLGRVTSGEGGKIISDFAHMVLEVEFPELAGKLHVHLPDEKQKRLGQAVVAASLPKIS